MRKHLVFFRAVGVTAPDNATPNEILDLAIRKLRFMPGEIATKADIQPGEAYMPMDEKVYENPTDIDRIFLNIQGATVQNIVATLPMEVVTIDYDVFEADDPRPLFISNVDYVLKPGELYSEVGKSQDHKMSKEEKVVNKLLKQNKL